MLLCLFIVSCETEEEVFNRTRVDIPEEILEIDSDSLSLHTELSLETNNEKGKSALERSKDFFTWYKTNQKTFYEKQNSCVGIEDEYFVVDQSALNKYIDFLTASNFFSDSLTQETESVWENHCSDQMADYKANGDKADGIPPCVYEGDIFFLMQETPSESDFNSLTFKVESESDNKTIIHTGTRSLTWILQDDVWMLNQF